MIETNKVCVYVAAQWARRMEAAVAAQHLRNAGFLIVSTWHDGDPDSVEGDYKASGEERENLQAELASKDVQEITDEADMVLLLSEPPGSVQAGGNRHIEFGIGYAQGKTCVVVGPKELMFHRLPGVLQFDTLKDFIDRRDDFMKVKAALVSKDSEAASRKSYPLCTGVIDYFPDALMDVAHVSKVGNDQHNPGEPLHWAKEKSTDHADALLRHLKDRGKRDTDGERHSSKVAWRALALLQTEIENDL